MNNSSISNILCGAVFSILASVSIGASAGGYSETLVNGQAQSLETFAVSYADLDLSKSEGIEALHRRISNAARKVCGPSDYRQAGSLRISARNKACYDDAVSEGISQIDSAQMAADSQ